DPALVHHYFGAKEDLFIAALQLPVDPRTVLQAVVEHGPDDAGERLLRTLLSVWDDPQLQLPLLGLARSLVQPEGRRLVRDGFLRVVVAPLGRRLGIDDPDRRMPLVASQIFGLVLMRYVLEVEPLASMPAEQVVATYAPTLQRYLTGTLPGPAG
ncbi:MAG: TetR/AcrR family transcriptional regulator, partial [Gaiellaceae bacterium]